MLDGPEHRFLELLDLRVRRIVANLLQLSVEREERLMEASGMNDPDYKYGGKFKAVPPEEVARILKS